VQLQNRRPSSPPSLPSNSAYYLATNFGEGSLLQQDNCTLPEATYPQNLDRWLVPDDPFLGVSAAIRRLGELAHKVAACNDPVLVLGETGSGKGVLASWLHANSPRRKHPFLDLNCAGLDREFLDTELFGHEKGAFTSAVAAKPGLLETAHQGTVFLDEIGDVDLQVQPKLLKVLETGRFRRLGEVRDRYADVRLISATHRNLSQAVQAGRFRSDLFYRINIIIVEVPPLRSRPEDIPYLALRLLDSLAPPRDGVAMRLDDSATQALQEYSWPGNIRELRNVLQRALLVTESRVITARELHFFPVSFQPQPAPAPPSADLTLRELEKAHIANVLALEAGSVQKAARRLGIPRSSLYNKLNRLGIANARL